ncbi:protein tyrosine phosphatase domain-containing protein 1 isoform 2-T2 [Syngnathus typhle]
MQTHVPVPRPAYSQARENLVKVIPPKLLCLLACGGVDCRYEGPECWKANQQVIRGVFSSWVTDDIIAMARPSKLLIDKYDIIEQFQRYCLEFKSEVHNSCGWWHCVLLIYDLFPRLNIKSIINMQMPGEHAHCGPPLDPKSGFTYSPQIFMENDIYFYNFGMPDFCVSSLVNIIDGVKVLAFAVGEGRVAVHCHAGLGRTGVLIACYLIYTLRISPSEAVHYVRIKRPRSIQTRGQISQVFDFARLLSAQLLQYPDLSLRHGSPVTLQHYLNRQALLLHGQEARTLRYIPKVVYLLCMHISCLAMGLPAAPEIHAELEKRSELRILTRVVRETLVSKQFLPLLRQDQNIARVGSVSSWDGQLGFSERNRDLLRDKRSYSDSDLSMMADLEMGPWLAKDAIGSELRPVSSKTTPPSLHLTTNNRAQTRAKQPSKSSGRMFKSTVKKDQSKYSSNIELCRSTHNVRPTSVARAIANAMADLSPPEESILQRSSLLQEELNSSECGWALLVTETNPQVLTCLLWTWLEKLKDPVLGAEDIVRLSCVEPNRKPFCVLKKSQRHTIYCLLSCVNKVTRLCPHREDAVLQRLIRALTKRPQEEIKSLARLLNLIRAHLRENFLNIC